MPRIRDGASADRLERAWPVMPEFPKILGHNNGANCQENYHPTEQHQRRSNQMSGVSKPTTHRSPFQKRILVESQRGQEGTRGQPK